MMSSLWAMGEVSHRPDPDGSAGREVKIDHREEDIRIP